MFILSEKHLKKRILTILSGFPGNDHIIQVQERTQDATICYTGEKSAVIALLRSFQYEKVDVPDV